MSLCHGREVLALQAAADSAGGVLFCWISVPSFGPFPFRLKNGLNRIRCLQTFTVSAVHRNKRQSPRHP